MASTTKGRTVAHASNTARGTASGSIKRAPTSGERPNAQTPTRMQAPPDIVVALSGPGRIPELSVYTFAADVPPQVGRTLIFALWSEDEIRSVEGRRCYTCNMFVDAAKGGPEGTAPEGQPHRP